MRKKKSFLNILKERFRIVILEEQSLQEKKTILLNWFQIITRLLSGILIIATVNTLIIAYTPLREYIPGYAPPYLSKNLIYLSNKTDSLIADLKIKEQKQLMLENIMKGKLVDDSHFSDASIPANIGNKDIIASHNDSAFRISVEREDQFNVLIDEQIMPSSIINTAFYAPIKGVISDAFDQRKKHFGIDVVAPKDEAIKATLPGTVVLSSWTTETGYTMAIQHKDDLISFYKHNSVLLKNIGEKVLAGDVIAIIGNSGSLSSGPHLHFELWHKGKAINPQHHIIF
jgi:murein DD-endopeptidase MepM/ murein hydrolase activator NlpD